MKQFKDKLNGDSIHVYKKNGDWFVKLTAKGEWLRRAKEYGPFDAEGEALLAICINKEIQFKNYEQVYP